MNKIKQMGLLALFSMVASCADDKNTAFVPFDETSSAVKSNVVVFETILRKNDVSDAQIHKALGSDVTIRRDIDNYLYIQQEYNDLKGCRQAAFDLAAAFPKDKSYISARRPFACSHGVYKFKMAEGLLAIDLKNGGAKSFWKPSKASI